MRYSRLSAIALACSIALMSPRCASAELTRASWERMSVREQDIYAAGYLDGLMVALTPGGVSVETRSSPFSECLKQRRFSPLELRAIVEKSLLGDGSWQPKDMPLSLVFLAAMGDTCKR